ncbi:putative ComEC/Rec2-related protein [Gordonia polyisoprenivorans NBRC 16320 = JCM 10675]|uniref:ComEC/Rec2 family competence protein n=1 Tax=Gordonia polyisoprenivorans TaxID=84595 RepID=A0A846WPS4_9ACTN|nr:MULTISPECIES: ComEC/Rec2 family competence protein [Gordonia]MDF3280409.1 ComEC/Rec2 family competence protein [Gordonia sp. N1V]NKY03638.1 ComEC/Rec2 family competence protein [Gordonia polyisoprenivorans]WCB35636.1 ComEC/Rec2 family competence protein [Gordonia polyisoprenivorans]GAB23959.1 putative ComEC/Rec2-related protein [Gordonia polyisoprenivorans NBRC 16320 = JCM 10675]
MRDQDLRLLSPAVVVWIITAVCLGATVRVAVMIAVSSTVVAVVVVLMWRTRRLGWKIAGPAVVCAVLAATCATAMALRLEIRDRHPVHEMHGKATMWLTLREDPVAFGPAAAGMVRARVEIDAVARRSVSTAGAELVGRAQSWAGVLPGQRVRVLVTVRPPPPGELVVARVTESGAPTLLGRPPPHQRVAGHIRERLQRSAVRALSPEASGLFPGLVLGDESALSSEVRDDFRAAGLLHLTAVSGANFAVVCGAVIFAFRLAGASPKVVAVAGALTIVGFVILVRPSPSVLRAAMMGGVGLLALLSSRRSQALPALGAAVIGGVLWWPELAREPGFVLSVVATAGLVMVAPGIRDALRAVRVPAGIAEVTAMAVAAAVTTSPMIAYLSGTLSLVTVLANVAVAPVVAVVGIVGTAAALIGAFGRVDGIPMMVSELLIRAMAPEVWWMITCADRLGSWRWAVIGIPEGWPGVMVSLMCSAVIVAVAAAVRHIDADSVRIAVLRCRRGLARWGP